VERVKPTTYRCHQFNSSPESLESFKWRYFGLQRERIVNIMMKGKMKMPSVSIVGVGKNRSGFQPLPPSETEPPALAAARKSRAEKNRKVFKIAATVILSSALLAGLVAFFLTYRTSDLVYSSATPGERTMSTSISHPDLVAQVSSSNDQFALSLLGQVKGEKGVNTVMSPFSVSTVMAMVGAGSRGSTLAQISEGMNFKDQDQLLTGYSELLPALRSNENFTLETANSAFVMTNYQMLSEYQDTIRKHFHLSLQSTDFGDNQKSARLINDWVKDFTKEKIKDLFQPSSFNQNTSIVLVNAIYFKGDWTNKFDPKLTKKSDFYLQPDQTIKVDMMNKEEKYRIARIRGRKTGGYSMLELPYKGDRIVMLILLPDTGFYGTTLEEMEQKLDFHNIEKSFPKNRDIDKIKLELPKFKIESEIPLKDVLMNLGITDMFGEGADLTGIDPSGKLYVSEVKQKAFIEVNEEGAEAAAATGAVMMMRSMPMPATEFKVNRPFIFLLRDKLTGMLLFQGRVNDPSK